MKTMISGISKGYSFAVSKGDYLWHLKKVFNLTSRRVIPLATKFNSAILEGKLMKIIDFWPPKG
jgi:hypothetical protein